MNAKLRASAERRAKVVADKYISRDGGPPIKPDNLINSFSQEIRDIAAFIVWHSPNDMHGLVKPKDAFNAFCRLIDVKPHILRNIVKPPPELL